MIIIFHSCLSIPTPHSAVNTYSTLPLNLIIDAIEKHECEVIKLRQIVLEDLEICFSGRLLDAVMTSFRSADVVLRLSCCVCTIHDFLDTVSLHRMSVIVTYIYARL